MGYSAYSSIQSAIEMAQLLFFVALFVSAVICGMFAVTVARAKNRSATEWFWAAFFCNFVALIALAGMPSLPKRAILEPGKESEPKPFHDHAVLHDGCSPCLEALDKYGMSKPELFCPEGKRLAANAA